MRLHGILDRGEEAGGDRALSLAPHAAWIEEHRAQARLLGPDHVDEIRIADVDRFLRGGARRAHTELEDSRVGLRNPDHAGIDDELQMRGEPGDLERSLHGAVRVRDDADDEPGVARVAQGLSRFAVGLMAKPDRHVEAAPPLGNSDPFGVVGDPEILRQIPDVPALAGALARRLRGPLGIEPYAGAPFGVDHVSRAELVTSRRQERGEPGVVHFQQRVPGVEYDSAHDGVGHDGRVYRAAAETALPLFIDGPSM